MGTNFYLPGRDDDLHIGKRSAAGGGLCSFSLQGHLNLDGRSITTWAEWKQTIRAIGKVVDEYGQTHSAKDFIAEVESTTPENRSRQYDWAVANPEWWRDDDDWLCPDGFSFSFREFT